MFFFLQHPQKPLPCRTLKLHIATSFSVLYQRLLLSARRTRCHVVEKSRGHHFPNILLLTHYIIRSHFFLPLCTGAHIHCHRAAGCMCAPRAVCVVVTERCRGGCSLLSGIALILLTDYWLGLERERRPAWGDMRTDVSRPASTKYTHTDSIYV